MQSRPTAIVSGAASGIGAACATALAAKGFNIVVNYSRSADKAETVAAACRAFRVEAIAVQADIADDAACRRLVDETVTGWGRIDLLVNNAGVTKFADAKDLDALSAEDFERVMGVNVTGTYQLTRAASPYLKQSPVASVVNISSHSGFSGIGSSIAYAASKGALNTMTRSLALALAPEIRVNGVCPGFVDTDWMSKKLDSEDLDAFKIKVAAISPLQRIVPAADVAEAVCWFGIEAQSITGQLLVIDCGTHLTVGNPL